MNDMNQVRCPLCKKSVTGQKNGALGLHWITLSPRTPCRGIYKTLDQINGKKPWGEFVFLTSYGFIVTKNEVYRTAGNVVNHNVGGHLFRLAIEFFDPKLFGYLKKYIISYDGRYD